MTAPDRIPPSRRAAKENFILLLWVCGWLRIRNHKVAKEHARSLPRGLGIPLRYKTIPEGHNRCFRGVDLSDAHAQRLLSEPSGVLLAKKGLISYSLSSFTAVSFALSSPSVVVEKPIFRRDVILYIPAVIDDLTWLCARNEDEWLTLREQYQFFVDEKEILYSDHNSELRTIRFEECVLRDFKYREWPELEPLMHPDLPPEISLYLSDRPDEISACLDKITMKRWRQMTRREGWQSESAIDLAA